MASLLVLQIHLDLRVFGSPSCTFAIFPIVFVQRVCSTCGRVQVVPFPARVYEGFPKLLSQTSVVGAVLYSGPCNWCFGVHSQLCKLRTVCRWIFLAWSACDRLFVACYFELCGHYIGFLVLKVGIICNIYINSSFKSIPAEDGVLFVLGLWFVVAVCLNFDARLIFFEESYFFEQAQLDWSTYSRMAFPHIPFGGISEFRFFNEASTYSLRTTLPVLFPTLWFSFSHFYCDSPCSLFVFGLFFWPIVTRVICYFS